MSDPIVRSQSGRQNLGKAGLKKAGGASRSASATAADASNAQMARQGPAGSKERLTNFLSKLETTWKMFERSTLDSDDGVLPKDGQMAFLGEEEAPTPETLKRMRAKVQARAQKPQKGAPYLLRSSAQQPGQKSNKQAKSSPSPGHAGPKESPQSDRNTPRPPTQRSAPPSPSRRGAEPQGAKRQSAPGSGGTKSAGPQGKSPASPGQRSTSGFQAPQVRTPSMPARGPQPRGSVLGRKPGQAASKAPQPRSQRAPATPGKGSPPSAPAPRAGRQPQILRRPGGGGSWRPTGPSGSKSFLGTSSTSGAQMRQSDAAGRPGRAVATTGLGRQAVYSNSHARVHPRVTQRHVSGQMPVHSSFLDEKHKSQSKEGTPLRLTWTPGPKGTRSQNQRIFAHRYRLQLARQGKSGQALGPRISMAPSSQARTDVAGRVAGNAIGTLLDELYEEEDLEKLDEETAVSSLALILRMGGEFTYKHSTRVLDLALELADEVGVRDKTTRKEIKFGTMLRNIGEFDFLLQGEEDSKEKLKDMSEFLGGQDMLRAGLLHDIGKVQIPPEILYKPGKLTPEEYEIIKMHPIYGEEIVRPIASLRYLCPTIRGHHERWDGKGYPDGLAGEDIPMAARVIAVADVFDALSAERPYKAGMEVKKVRGILAEGRGTHFDPSLVDAFLDIIARRYPDVE